MHTALDSSFVARLKQLLASRYGKGLQVRQLMDSAEMNSQDVYTKGRDLHIPIRVNGAFLGTAVIPSADDLNQEKRQGVSQLVRMVLEPAMYKWYLDQKEANLVELTKAHPALDNVRLFGEEPMPIFDEIIRDNLEALNESPGAELISHLIHLQGSSEIANKKVALQLHELTSRWAFVPFEDIKGQLHSAHDIAKMGGMTIFIEGTERLNDAEQELLMDYIAEERGPEEPLIISTSLLSFDDPKHGNLRPRLVEELSVNSFDVDRAPLTAQGLKEVLELFFMKDTGLDS